MGYINFENMAALQRELILYQMRNQILTEQYGTHYKPMVFLVGTN